MTQLAELERESSARRERQKDFGVFYTPSAAVAALVRWAIRSESDRMLDPSCGDGRFLRLHRSCVGVEQDVTASRTARLTAPWALIHDHEFFGWAAETTERFECAAGNPPFIRYQRFAGEVRERALKLCRSLGAGFSALSSSWAPFLVATAALLKPGGRVAFVVPAEVGHATYAEPLLRYLLTHFSRVQFVAIREKVFPELSEDVWLLFADGFGGATDHFLLSTVSRFEYSADPPSHGVKVGRQEWEAWRGRLRPFVLSSEVRDLYRRVLDTSGTVRLGELARVGIGYVTGANDFFHLRPSQARKLGIPRALLHASVRNSRALPANAVTRATVDGWERRDDPMLLLRLRAEGPLPNPVREYLDSAMARKVRKTYKCRNRQPWYVVPDVTVPDAFLSYMSGFRPTLVANRAGCVCTNSLHTVRLKKRLSVAALQRMWRDAYTQLSCEIEGHPLGGGMLKLEPREAQRVVLVANPRWSHGEMSLLTEGVEALRSWRHCGG